MQSCDKGLPSTSVYSIHSVLQCIKGYIYFLKIFHGHWQTKGTLKSSFYIWGGGGVGGVAEARARDAPLVKLPMLSSSEITKKFFNLIDVELMFASK